MTPWEFNCCIDGWQEANTPPDKTGKNSDLPTLSYDEFREFMDS